MRVLSRELTAPHTINLVWGAILFVLVHYTMAHGEEASLSLWYLLESAPENEAQEARQTLILYYQFLVLGMARKLKSKLPTWINDEDLISYGQIGLIKAVDRYDYRQGPFSSFASTYVHGAILDELRSQDWAPRGLRRDQRLLAGAMNDLSNEAEDGYSRVTDVEIAGHLDWSVHRVQNTVKKINNAVPLHYDGVVEDFRDARREDDVEGAASASVMCDNFVKLYYQMPETTQVILAHRYYLGETMSVVSDTLGLPSATVRQIHTDAVTTILKNIAASVT